jgi:hypothetical protein
MHHAASTAPHPRSPRPPAAAVPAAIVLALLALVATLGIAGPATAARGGTAVAAAAVDHHRDTGTRADDGRDTAGVLRVATRSETHREHPAPRCHLTACAQGTGTTPPARAQPPASGGHLPSSRPHAHDDRGRGPPAPSGN